MDQRLECCEFGDLCVIAGTVVRSGNCVVTGISVALLLLSREVH